MFSSMRKSNRKIFVFAVIIVILAFVGMTFFSWGLNYVSGKNNYSIIVNGKKVGLEEYYDVYEYINQLNSEQGTSSSEVDIVVNSLKQLLQVTLLDQYAKKSNVPVSDVEVSLYIRGIFTNQTVPFTTENYQQFLSGNGIDAAEYEASIKTTLKRQKLLNTIASAVAPNQEELNKQILFFTQTVDIGGVFINPPLMTNPIADTYSEDDLKEFYSNNIDNYSGDTLYNFSYIEIALKDIDIDVDSITDQDAKDYYDDNSQQYFIPSQIDISVVKIPTYAADVASNISNNITSGATAYPDAVAELIKEYGANNITVENNLIYSSDSLPQQYSIARQLKVNSAYVVNTSSILYINNKEETSYKNFTDIKADIKKQLGYEYALIEISAKLNRDIELLFDGAGEYKVYSTNYFEAKNLPEVFSDDTLTFQSLMLSGEGEISSPMVSKDESVIRIFRTEPLIIGGVRNFQFVKDEVIKDYMKDYSLEATTRELEEIIKTGENLDTIAEKYGEETIFLKESDYSSVVARFNVSMEDIFQLYNSPTNSIKIFFNKNRILLLSVSDKKKGNFNTPSQRFLEYTINDSLQKAKMNTAQASFLEYLESTATVEYNSLLLSQYGIDLDDLNK